MFINKVKKGWQELEDEIIKTGKCVYCGACGAFCANVSFDLAKEVPVEDGSCKDENTCRDGYGICYNLCPKTETDTIPLDILDKWVFGKEQNKILGHYLRIASVKVRDDVYDLPRQSGPATALLHTAMDAGVIDALITTTKDESFKPLPMIAEKKDDLGKGVGYKPSQSPTLSLIGDAINKEYVNIGVVGTPCQIQALRKLQNHPGFDFEAYDLVSLAIGTFCFGTFYNQLLDEIYNQNDINPKEIQKIEHDREKFKLKVLNNSKTSELFLNELYDKTIRKACFSCSDYTASFADISIGEVGSDEGWNTVIIRTKKGEQVYNLALEKGILEEKSLDTDNEELILDITRNKTEICTIEKIVERSPELKSVFVRSAQVARSYRPGNFVVLWIPDIDFLPMSVSKVEGNLLEITVQKIGEGTTALFEKKVGDKIGIRGPFGNSWNYEDATNILVTGGGVGIAAITTLIEPLKANKKNVFVAIGAKDKASLLFSDRLMELIPNTMCTTDDGSVGKKCFVTDAVEDIINNENIDLILTCGPEIMMKKVLEIANNKNIEVQASLERKMKCGVGLCGSCCLGENNNISVCKEGPIFTAEQLSLFPQFGTYKK